MFQLCLSRMSVFLQNPLEEAAFVNYGLSVNYKAGVEKLGYVIFM